MMQLLERLKKGILIMDGAMGTQIQARGVPAPAWGGHEGCNEWLNLGAPELIRDIHLAYYQAGSDAVETNTFGATPLTLAEFGLADQAFEINRAAARNARAAADSIATPGKPRYVFGSMGPGTKLPTLGQTDFARLREAYEIQVAGLVAGGVDGLLIETCQDLLQIKAALAGVRKALGEKHDKIVYVSVTVEQTGTLLIGANIGAVVAALAPYPIHILGLNCATGPEAMRIHLDYLAEHWPGRLGCMPNAGLPIMKAGGVEYPLKPAGFATALGTMARAVNLNVAGGCCGTTPDHIRALEESLRGFVPPPRTVAFPDQAASVFAAMDLTQTPPPLYVGERANATGSKKFRDLLLANNHEAAFQILQEQEEQGAHVLDLSCAYAGRDETADMTQLVARAARECRLPLMIDTTQLEVAEAALKLYGGRAIINSVNFEAGEARAGQTVDLARQYGAALVALTIDEQGMAMTAARKVEVAKRLVKFCEARGLRRGDLLLDTLTFTIGSGDDNLRTAALETLSAIRQIKQELPGVRTILGLSNISFGLKPAGRKVLNAVFLDQCLKAGLDACIINVAAIAPLNQIPAAAIAVATALLANDTAHGDPLAAFIQFFEGQTETENPAGKAALAPAEAVAEALIKGRAQGVEAGIPALLQSHTAEHILNEILIPAMKEVGRLFNEGILQLPFVLKSAEVMKKAVALIKPHMQKDADTAARGLLVLATVAGDVHDIGKNLVDIILSNNGFTVVNLGTKIPVEQMLAAVKEHKADVLGMSGLLVKSAATMKENLKALKAAGIKIPVFLGGAALTRSFVEEACQPEYDGPVVYCKDAFEGLAQMRELAETGTLAPPARPGTPVAATREPAAAPAVPIDRQVPAIVPPFWGARIVRHISLHDVYPFLNETALVRGRWGYRRGKQGATEYQRLIESEVRPRLAQMKIEAARSGLLKAQAAYGYFRCHADGDTLWVQPGGGSPLPLHFPRQAHAPHWSIPDFFRADEDVAGFMVVTLGAGLEEETMRLRKRDHYQDYFLLHGFAVEVTDALAEYWHRQMRREAGFEEPAFTMQDYIVQKYRGSRYGFGYPSCPELAMNKLCCELVQAHEIGVGVTENFMMTPEVSTCALVVFHPQAKYFNL